MGETGQYSCGMVSHTRQMASREGAVLAEVLTPTMVASLQKKKLLAPDLAQRYGTLIRHDELRQYPCAALVKAGLGLGPEEDWPKADGDRPPVPARETMLVAGVLVPDPATYDLFKEWWNSRSPADFDTDLVGRVVQAWDLFTTELNNLRTVRAGQKSMTPRNKKNKETGVVASSIRTGKIRRQKLLPFEAGPAVTDLTSARRRAPDDDDDDDDDNPPSPYVPRKIFKSSTGGPPPRLHPARK